MSYSQGGRGTSKHLWGTRDYTTAPTIRPPRPKVLTVFIRPDGTPDRLIPCETCGTSYYETTIVVGEACMCCGTPRTTPTVAARTEDHLYRMYRH